MQKGILVCTDLDARLIWSIDDPAGVAHFYSHTLEWMALPDSQQPGPGTGRSE